MGPARSRCAPPRARALGAVKRSRRMTRMRLVTAQRIALAGLAGGCSDSPTCAETVADICAKANTCSDGDRAWIMFHEPSPQTPIWAYGNEELCREGLVDVQGGCEAGGPGSSRATW